MNLTNKLIKNNIIEEKSNEEEICLAIKQTLTQDSTGTMVYLQLNSLNIAKVQTELSISYIDHNMLQSGFENADDHLFIRTSALKHGVIFSKAGNGICHRLHLENFALPNKTLLGSDSHTPTCGALGMLAIGAGGLDVAIAMATTEYYLKNPKVLNIKLINSLPKYSSAKDLILTIIKQLGVKGGIGYIIEYSGDGVKTLSVEQRATITNMGAELGATTSIFPSDERTLEFLKAQGRADDYLELSADSDAKYDKEIIIDLSSIEPVVAQPHSPDNVIEISQLDKIKVDQVAIGSCTNSSYEDLVLLANILKEQKVHPDVSLVVSIGSANLMMMLANEGYLAILINSGARILESACGPCIGMGQAPKSNGVSLRTFNRNFKGRSGTIDAKVYLGSVECAALSAINGYITSFKGFEDQYEKISKVDKYYRDLSIFEYPNRQDQIEIVMGENIKEFPKMKVVDYLKDAQIVLKAQDNVTTDDICPSNANLLPYRSNIPKLAHYCFATLSDNFYDLAQKNDNNLIIGGNNFGQGSSREHAALLLVYLNVKAVVAKSFARIHRSNLINNGIYPLTFVDENDYNKIKDSDVIDFDLKSLLQDEVYLIINNNKSNIKIKLNASLREKEMLSYGGSLNLITKQLKES